MTTRFPSWNDIINAAAKVIDEGWECRIEPHHIAEQRRADAAASEDDFNMRLWRDVWVYLMSKKYLLQQRIAA